jgi:hypothetical protein
VRLTWLALGAAVVLYPSPGNADFPTTQYTSMTYPGFDVGGPLNAFYCPPFGDPKYAPQPVNLYVPNLPDGGTVPLLLYFPGTGDDLNLGQLTTAQSDAFVKRAAEMGVAAAAVAYRSLTIDLHFLWPDHLNAKAQCIWNSDPTSAISQLCSNQGPLAASSTKIDCSLGIAVAGHSQGGMMAVIARNYDDRVLAAHTLGAGAYYDPSSACLNDLTCVWGALSFSHIADPNVVIARDAGFDGFVMGSSDRRVLTSDRIRAEAGDIDPYFHGLNDGGPVTLDDIAARLNDMSNLSCPGASPSTCPGPADGGSGWIIVGGSQLAPCMANTACAATPPASHAGHCFFSDGDSPGCANNSGPPETWVPDPDYFDRSAPAGFALDPSLRWLLGFFPGPDAGASVDAGRTTDAGTTSDAGAVTDAGVGTDAGVLADSGSLDAGTSGPPAGCGCHEYPFPAAWLGMLALVAIRFSPPRSRRS